MQRLLRPRLYVSSLLEINLEKLKREGIKGFIIDLDNTLTPWAENMVAPEIKKWVSLLGAQGLKACLFSNNEKKGREEVVALLGIPGIFSARKPRRRAFYQALALLKTAPWETAVIGDQLFTDILGGNRLGLYTILVPPLSKREFIGTKFMRGLERLVWPFVMGKGRVFGRGD